MVYFLSDLHLGASYIADPIGHERAVAALLRRMADDATELYLLGDVMDYWFEYRNVVPRGFTRFLGALAELVDSGVKVTWLKGNHDIWMTDYLTTEVGVEIVDGILDRTILGRRFVMEHGDGVGRRPWSFRLLRRLFRSSVARRLYAAIHPRWTVGFAHSWSSHSRKAGGYNAPDPTPLVDWARLYVEQQGPVDYFVFGHLHLPYQTTILDGKTTVTILGDAFRSNSYATFDGRQLTLHTFPEVEKSGKK